MPELKYPISPNKDSQNDVANNEKPVTIITNRLLMDKLLDINAVMLTSFDRDHVVHQSKLTSDKQIC